jgi:DNA-binding MarR family transcriptional regulator
MTKCKEINKLNKVVVKKGKVKYEVDSLKTFHRFLKLHQCLLSAFSENIEHKFNLSLNEFRVLMVVGWNGVAASNEVAEETGMLIMAISRTVSKLQKKGYIAMEVDPENRRRKPLRLTEEGDRLFMALKPTATEAADYIFESLRIDEFMTFDYSLQELLESISAVDEEGKSIFIEKTRSKDIDSQE